MSFWVTNKSKDIPVMSSTPSKVLRMSIFTSLIFTRNFSSTAASPVAWKEDKTFKSQEKHYNLKAPCANLLLTHTLTWEVKGKTKMRVTFSFRTWPIKWVPVAFPGSNPFRRNRSWLSHAFATFQLQIAPRPPLCSKYCYIMRNKICWRIRDYSVIYTGRHEHLNRSVHFFKLSNNFM